MPDRYGDTDDDDDLPPVVDLGPRIKARGLEDAVDLVRLQRSHLTQMPDGRKSKSEIREEARQHRIAMQETHAAIRNAGIPACELCDSDGYLPTGFVCDHVDRRETYARGRHLVRSRMGWRQSTAGPTSPIEARQWPAQRRNQAGEPNHTQNGIRDAQGRSRVGAESE